MFTMVAIVATAFGGGSSAHSYAERLRCICSGERARRRALNWHFSLGAVSLRASWLLWRPRTLHDIHFYTRT